MLTIAYAGDDEVIGNTLVGVNEVPKNDSQAAKNAVGDPSGVVYMNLRIYQDDDNKPKWVKYTVNTMRMTGEMPPTKTHVHKGKKGTNGDVLLDLPCKYVKTGSNEWHCEGSLGKNKADRTDSLLSALQKLVNRPNKYYGNIHTKRYPDGAVRGQLWNV
ncbi:unnamed protein product [Closterium sp. Naga37s-1]|nr:unnamed protein product [Closterium sp. Naga37s-1]